MWASDYPHPDRTRPESRQAIEDSFRGIAFDTCRRILRDDARQLFGL
jgi:predicted TIM-barrel fold metal-dependent hydrolase